MITVNVSINGFDQNDYDNCSDRICPAEVVFKLTGELEQAAIQYWRYLDSYGKEVKDIISNSVSLRRGETEAETVLLAAGRYTISLPPDERNSNISGTKSGSIDVSGTPAP